MKKASYILSLTFLLSGGCMLTDNLFAPADSITGADIKEQAASAAAVGWVVGMKMKMKDVSDFFESYGFPKEVARELASQMIAGMGKNWKRTYVITPLEMSIEDDKFYDKSSAKKCVENVRTTGILVAFISIDTMIAQMKDGSFFTVPHSGCDAITELTDWSACISKTSSMTAGYGATRCELKQNSKFINLGPVRL